MLANRLAFVTGGGRGLGEAIARVMAREGANVTVGKDNFNLNNELSKSLKNIL